MNELELAQAAYASVPEPDAATVADARAAFVARIGRRRSRRLPVALGFAAAAAAASVAVLGLLPSRAEGLPAKAIIRGAYVASLPPVSGIRHVRESLHTVGFPGHSILDEWFSVTAPFALHTRAADASSGLLQESEWSTCGSITYDSRQNALSVNGWPTPLTVRHSLRLVSDPLLAFQAAYRGHRVSYGDKTTFNGLPAYKLVIDQGHGTTLTYIVRRGSFAPLQDTRTVAGVRGGTTVTTYLAFETLTRTPQNERLLHVAPRTQALLFHTGRFASSGPCRTFGSFDALRKETP